MYRPLAVLLLILAFPTSAAVRTSGNVVIVTTNERTFPFDRPFDLEGRTVRFTPAEGGYRVETQELQWTEDAGPLLATLNTPFESATVNLAFAFPFAGAARTSFTVDGFGAIRFGAQELTRNAQLYDVHVAGIGEPLIAPLLRGGRLDRQVAVHLRQEPSFALVTWRELSYDIQARLGADGTIAFSYERAPSFLNGAAVVTTGRARGREVLATFEGIEVARIAMSDLIEVRIASATHGKYEIDIGDVDLNSGIDVYLPALEYRPGNWTRVPLGAPAVQLEDDTLVVRISDDMIRWRDADNTITVTTPAGTFTAPIARGHVAANAALDLSNTNVTRSGPLFETFTRGYVNTYAIWDEIAAALSYRDADIDTVAIYTDLIIDLNNLGIAYSTVGNDGASGVMLQVDAHDPVGPDAPVRPALLLMAGAGPDVPLLLHEFGHRWSMNLAPLVLNRDFHPTVFVHTPSAFPLRANEVSCMGGTHFAESAPGVFAASRASTCGYSWLDLYLMGLAAPEEVPPFFHLTNADRDVPAGPLLAPIEVRATKNVTTIDDIVREMGPRTPSSAQARKVFRTLFVVLESASEPAAAAQIEMLEMLRGQFANEFARATGNRGRIDSALRHQPRRRAVRH
ncbi:MAG TPA: hypothetical protein VEK11_07065 [Thermoanaerobaculia bacterium]|nr:hypothetical protein [Thermoanaerobaculia bacterium]